MFQNHLSVPGIEVIRAPHIYQSRCNKQSPHRALVDIYDNTYTFKFMKKKKAKRWTTKSQYAAPRDKEHVSVYRNL